MKAVAVVPEEHSVRVVDHPEPKLEQPEDVLLRILDVGVCGTDREIARFEYGTPPPGSDYLVIGHESLAEVVETGPNVTRVKPGDLVVTMVRRPCARLDCPACRSGHPDFCVTGEFTERGINGLQGFMTEQVVDDQRYMHVVPAHLNSVGVLVEPLTIAEKALLEVVDVQDRLPWLSEDAIHSGTALVLGAGPVGLLGTLALLVRGFDTWVYSLEPADSAKGKWVQSVGGHYLSAKDASIAELGAKTRNIDLVYEATGVSHVAFQAMEVLGVNGIFIFTGVPSRKAPIEVDADLLMRNLVLQNQLVYGTVNAGSRAFENAIQDLAKFYETWPDAVTSLITGRYAPEEAESLLLGKSEGIKQVVTLRGE
ncbi:MAG: glucose 1-dehydrogenase [Candidatus Eisenbacteria bacterium]|nr:glucose 1-dehydrogenase [Candidatus Eisenbacteria bacterium]